MTEETVKEKLKSEIAPLPWEDLQRAFAQGILIIVSSDLDFLEVALDVSENSTTAIENWINEGKLGRVTDEQAKEWHANNTELLTVILKPWVLVQITQS